MPNPNAKKHILLIGAGRMGGALLYGWLNENPDTELEISIIDPGAPRDVRIMAEDDAVTLNPPLQSFAASPPDVTVLAVKPQLMDEALKPLQEIARDGGAFLSVAAGRSIASIRRGLGVDVPLVRAMPNTPASVGRGATVCVPSDGVDDELKDLCTQLLSVVGQVFWMEEEGLIDAVTALSGSGPAYVFHLAEAMAAAGEKLGLPADLAKDLARLTIGGAGEMLWQGENDAATLREQVTSPGGTTAAALEVLMGAEGFGPLLERALTAARDRGRELDKV